MRQVVNLRARIPLQLPTREAEREYELKVAAARRAQVVRYAVAPRVQLTLPNGGTVRTAGEEVKLSEFEGGTYAWTDGNGRRRQETKPAWRALRDAIEDGLVIEADGFDDPPRAA
jgi:hypothetical protein